MVVRPILLVSALISLAFSVASWSPSRQDTQPETARTILERATEAMGGRRLLAVATITGTGKLTQFTEKGDLAMFVDFVDYIKYPDRERTEFGKGKKRFIQTNVGATGWIYDGEQKALRDQNDEQVQSFQRSLRHNLDALLRKAHQPAVKLRHTGEKELWPRQRGEGLEIRLALEDGREEVIELFIDPQTSLPVSMVCEDEEDRFFLYRGFDGISWPLRIDHYKNGLRMSRIAYDSIAFNRDIDPKLFEKPENSGSVK